MTPAGEHLARRAREIVSQTRELPHELAGLNDLLSGPIHLGCHVGLASSALPGLLQGFSAEHPAVELHLTVADIDELLPRLEDRSLDLALTYDLQLPAEVRVHPVYDTRILAVVPAGHPLSEQPLLDVGALAGETLVQLDSVPSTSLNQLLLTERGVSPPRTLAVPQVELLYSLVGRGLGFGFIMSRPRLPATSQDGYPLAYVPIESVHAKSRVVVACETTAAARARVQTLVDFAVVHLSAQQLS